MSGNKAGGLKTARKNLEKDPDYYVKIGRLGGSTPREFRPFQDKEFASRVGRIGGTISRRKPKGTPA